jgi:uncharacterized membrane protein YraQ (UPF0718 family)
MSEAPLVGTLPARFGVQRQWLLVAVAAACAYPLARLALGTNPGAAQTFALVFSSIAIEALPFVLIGAVIAALLARFVPSRAFAWIGRLPLPLQVPAASLAGIALPVCECGSVPVARQLIAQGVHPAAGLGFMLAAPVINPIVLTTTFVAYSPHGLGFQFVAGRALVGLFTAITVGFVARDADATLLRPREHDHDHGRSGLVDHVLGDFVSMGRWVVLGAGLAGLFQATVPQDAFSSVGGARMLSTLAMMGLAFALSLCSEADAFVGAGFSGMPYGAQLAFLTFGPVADFKLALLYGATFKRGTALKVIAAAAAVVFSCTLWFGVAVR